LHSNLSNYHKGVELGEKARGGEFPRILLMLRNPSPLRCPVRPFGPRDRFVVYRVLPSVFAVNVASAVVAAQLAGLARIVACMFGMAKALPICFCMGHLLSIPLSITAKFKTIKTREIELAERKRPAKVPPQR